MRQYANAQDRAQAQAYLVCGCLLDLPRARHLLCKLCARCRLLLLARCLVS